MAKKTSEITRSAGLPTGYLGSVAGGGYSGATKRLDDIVARQAKLLAKVFGRDVEIRFNSDRHSGGAWLKDDLPGFAGNVQVGFNAGLQAVPPKGKTYHQWLNELGEKHGWGPGMDNELRKAPQGIGVSTYIKESVVKNPSIVNEGPENSRYASTEHRSLREGIEFLKKHVDKSKLNPYHGQQPHSPDESSEILEGEPTRVAVKSGRIPRKKHTEGRASGRRPSGLRAIGR